MKNTLFLIILPCFCFSQGQIFPKLVKDTSYIIKVQGIYTLVDENIYSTGDTLRTKQILGDSASASFFLLSQSENQSNIVADIIFPEVNAKENKRKIREYTRLYNSFNNRNVFSVTAIRDTAEMIGNWRLVFEDEKILGVIELNNNKRLIFNPDNGKVYTISTNLLLSTFTNQVSFAFNGVKYDLYKYADGKFATVDGDVRLIKIE
jgi:hypothetical protein